MSSGRTDYYAAVFFMDGKEVARQMLFSEFEALLDGYVGLSDMADTEARAVYVVLDKSLGIQSLVFFLIYFDEDGRADSSWNIPIERLASISGKGPDLGAGTIRLACRSQCSINWHQKELWDPDMNPASSHFAAIKKAVQQNRLKFKKESVQSIPVLSPGSDEVELPVLGNVDDAQRSRLAQQIRDQRLRIRTLTSTSEDALEEQARQHRNDVQMYKSKLQKAAQTIEQLKVRNEQLQGKLFQRNEQVMSLQDRVTDQSTHVHDLEQRLKHAKGMEKSEIERQKLQAELLLVREQLDRREVELLYRDEKEEQLKAELEDAKAAATGVAEKSLLEKLKALDVVFVSYHPGAGHVTVPFADVHRYASNPISYVAAKCLVTEEVYKRWLEHQEHPVCSARDEEGGICGETVSKVSNPGDFEPGVSDRCPQHQSH